ncbi:MAG: helix-turn-helix domain-containing protein [Chroococcidiopsidaceae cyanobacterium CP_BM_RX_35]|nr:helix-turn-helix domain-containing protein [Chroococcidiopsidaceae cyanobacterium CP_BM_RX_35]
MSDSTCLKTDSIASNSARTGLSKATLESLASRNSYNTRLSTIEKLCRALDCTPSDLLALVPDEETESRSRSK